MDLEWATTQEIMLELQNRKCGDFVFFLGGQMLIGNNVQLEALVEYAKALLAVAQDDANNDVQTPGLPIDDQMPSKPRKKKGKDK